MIFVNGHGTALKLWPLFVHKNVLLRHVLKFLDRVRLTIKLSQEFNIKYDLFVWLGPLSSLKALSSQETVATPRIELKLGFTKYQK
jgi:hypothetical protein